MSEPKPHPECYGNMIPDFENLQYNKPTEGRTFRVFVENIGGGRQRRELEVKRDNWEECSGCVDYRSCYDLGMAKLALHRALAQC